MVRRRTGWVMWFVVVFGLFNTCATHRERADVERQLKQSWSPSPSFIIQAIRSTGTDDGDINRYAAYANAIFGRPHAAYYVRDVAGWRADDKANDPDLSPIVSSSPLAPYRDFSVEYPPGFFAFALVPALIAPGSYALAFAILMGLVLTLCVWLCARIARSLDLDTEQLVTFAAVSALALGVICVRRYDAAVSLAACGLVWGVVSRRPALGGLAFGIGVAAKGVPLLLAPFALVFYVRQRRWREMAIASAVAAGVVVLAIVPFWGAPLFDMLRYHGERPIQVESTWGALLVIGKLVAPVATPFTYGSLNAVADFDGPLRTVASLLPVLAWLALIVHAWRGPSDERTMIRHVAVAIVAYMVLGKVFSPQYLTWLLPLGALASLSAGRTERILFVVALALTQVIYPFLYLTPLAWGGSPVFGVIVLARNGVLAVWAARLLRWRDG